MKIGNGISDIPRVGVNLTLVPGLEALDWFGRGPWENYADRKVSAMVGIYRSIVADQYVPYIMPQEHGHKTDVRWLALTDVRGQGLASQGTRRSNSRRATSRTTTCTGPVTPAI